MTTTSDFTTINLKYNSASTDAGATFTGNTINFGGSGGVQELRFAPTGSSYGSTGSASWPFVTRPTSGQGTQVVPGLWAVAATDNVAVQVQTYDGTVNHYAQFQWNWDSLGTFATAPLFTAYSDTTHANASAGTQTNSPAGAPVVNGQSTDTSSTSYLKANAYGTGGASVPSSNAGGTIAATTGTSGAISAANSTSWSGWQSLQAQLQWIVNGTTPTATTAGQWYWICILYVGPNMNTGTLTPVITFQYSFT